MFKRIMVAVVGIPLLLAVFIWAPEWATMLLLAAMCGIGACEMMRAVAGKAGKRLLPLAAAAAALVPVCIFQEEGIRNAGLTALPVLPITAALALVFVVSLFACAILRYGKEEAVPFADLTAAVFAGLVFPLMLSCLLRLRLAPMGRAMVFIPLAISFGSDTFAYFAGVLFGKHKLTPVSPKKTVEGAVGGLLGGVIGMALFQLLAGAFAGMALEWFLVAGLGVFGSAVSQIGDLSFSVIKREFGVKDYGNLLPGHGGILDRFDSVTFVAPFVWFIFSFL